MFLLNQVKVALLCKKNEVAVFEMQLLSEQEISSIRMKIRKRGVAIMLTALIGLFLLSCTSFWTVISPTLGFLVIMVSTIFPVTALSLMWDPREYQWLPSSQCGFLADICDREPGLQAYRNSVCAQGRQFTRQEALAMQHWADVQAIARWEAAAETADAACKRLYGVATN